MKLMAADPVRPHWCALVCSVYLGGCCTFRGFMPTCKSEGRNRQAKLPAWLVPWFDIGKMPGLAPPPNCLPCRRAAAAMRALSEDVLVAQLLLESGCGIINHCMILHWACKCSLLKSALQGFAVQVTKRSSIGRGLALVQGP